MKFLHLSDLHLGKRVNEFSMMEDQDYVLRQILSMTEEEEPDAVLIAGDVYDKPLPPAEAVRMFDDFLFRLSGKGVRVFIISGNHDSPDRLAFGSRLMEGSGIHMARAYGGHVAPVTMRDEWGPVNIWMLPFVKPADVRPFFPDREIADYTGAVAAAVGEMELRPEERNILVAHQFFTGAERCESEEITVGGTDCVDVSTVKGFDYVALGHIHGPQQVTAPHIRYCGTPLKYSFSERNHVKSVTVVQMGEKGRVEIRTRPLRFLRDMRQIRGSFEELTKGKKNGDPGAEDYLHVILTDEEDVPDAMARLRTVYPNMMKLDYDNTRTRTEAEIGEADMTRGKSETELFAEFYEKQTGNTLTQDQLALATELMEKIREGMGGRK